jgi:hypothetical protein
MTQSRCLVFYIEYPEYVVDNRLGWYNRTRNKQCGRIRRSDKTATHAVVILYQH